MTSCRFSGDFHEILRAFPDSQGDLHDMLWDLRGCPLSDILQILGVICMRFCVEFLCFLTCC